MRDSDESLLNSFALNRDETAFRALAERYLGLVFHTALRRTNNRPLAEEVSQNILCALAQKAPSLAKNPDLLPAWLHRATLYESSKAMRSESSYQRRKQLQHSDAISDSNSPWSDAVPHLDRALDKLPESDRSLLLLHYFENRPFPKIAQTLGKNPAAVQKQSQRALEKLSRILRSKGVTLSAAVLATGLTGELAKAAPAALLKSATAAVLSGTATYSSTGLTLMFATKSKALIPLVVLICAVPLAIQQVAISRAIRYNNRLSSYQAANASPAKHSPLSRGSSALVTSTPSGRISIAVLSRALDDARSSTLNYLNFQKTIESLTPDELVELIPEAIHLPEARRKKAELLEFLMKALARTDPGQAVKITLSADPRGEIAMLARLPGAFSAWTLKDPDAAFAFFQALFGNREFNPLTENGFSWSRNITTLVNEFVKSLVAVGSPHVRDVILMTPETNRSNTFFNSIGKASGSSYLHESGASPDLTAQNFANYLPLIREFVPEEEHKQAFDRLAFEVNCFSKDFDRILGEFAARSELLPAERSLLAASYAHSKIGTYYNTSPHPDLAAVEAAAKQWLELHVPDEAGAILEKAKVDTYVQEMGQMKRRIESIARNPDLTDSELVQELGSKVYGEMLSQALEQAARIKDPAKRAEVIHRLQNP